MFNFMRKNLISEEEKNNIKKILLFYEMHNDIFVDYSNSEEKRKIIKKIYKILNYDALPSLYSTSNNTEGIKVYRGISADNIDLLKNYSNDFIKGDIFYGGRASIYGTGIYTIMGNDSNVALDYASDGGTNNCGVVIESTMKSDTKIIKSSQIDEIRTFTFERIRKIYKKDIEKFLEVLNDDGALAAILGYDAIFVEEKNYLVVLNRAKMVVNDVTLFGKIDELIDKYHKM